MAKVLVFLANGFEEIEALTPVDLLRRAGIDVYTVSITSEKTVTGSHRIPVVADMVYADVDFESADMLVFPGGLPGTTNLGEHSELMAKVEAFAENEDKYLGAICAAPSILGAHGVLNGKKAICFPGWEDKLVGATLVPGATAVIDGNVITSRGMGTAFEFGLAIIERLKSKETADKIAESVQFAPVN